MNFLELIQSINQDCNLSHKIKESSYVEKVIEENEKRKQGGDIWHDSIDNCIYHCCDTMISVLKSNEKDFYIQQLKIKMCSGIDEKEENYESFNYNIRIMNKSRIQRAIQEKNKLLTILYLSDYYKKHFVFIDDDSYYESSLLSYPKIYIECNKNHYRVIDTIDDKLTKKDILMNCNDLLIDNSSKIKSLNIYKTDMKAISNYTLTELMTIAVNLKINVKKNGKNKKKQELYNDILLFKVNVVH